MRHKATSYLDNAITLLLLLVAGITPLLFLNQTTEFYETPKLIFLVGSTLLLLGLWIFSWIVKGKVVITRTPLDIPLMVLLGVVVASTYFSVTRYPAIYGNLPRVHGTAVAWVTYILLYFVTVSHLKNLNIVRLFLYVLYGSATLVALISVLSFFNVFLPFDFASGVNFTPTGSSFSTVALLLLLLPFPLLSITNPNKYMPVPAAVVLAVLFSLTVVLIGSLPVYIGLLVAFGLSLFAPKSNQGRKTFPLLFIPVAVTVVTLVLSYLPLPGNALQSLQANFPKEIQLPFSVSWKVSASAFRDAPFIGTGPSSYLFNFTSYKPAEFNQFRFWNVAFDTAHNEFLQMLGTLGILGFLSLITVCLVTINTSRKTLMGDSTDHENVNALTLGLAISGIVAVFLLAIHATTLVSTVATLFVLAALMASQRAVRERVMELSLGLKASTAGNKQFDLLPVIIFIIFLIGAVPVIFQIVNAASADYYHRQALLQANQNGRLTYQYLQRAETLNPYVDLYRVDMAQTNFALANAIATNAIRTAQNEKQASPAAALTDQDRQTIQQLLSQAVNEGRVSIALSPRSARNWEVLANIYRNITGVAQNAVTFSLDAYGRAIQQDPLNPALRVNVGGLYYSLRSYDLAIRFFTDAANLKPDYANAYFNLSIALREKGDLQNARAVAEQTVRLLQDDKNNPSYKVATTLLDDLKKRIATGSAQTGGQAAPASQTNSALNQNIPNVNVNNLDNPPQVTPAPTVRPNPNAVRLTPTQAVKATPTP